MAEAQTPQACGCDKGSACCSTPKSNAKLLLWAALIAGALAVIGAVLYQNAVNEEPMLNTKHGKQLKAQQKAKAAAATVVDKAAAATEK